MESNRNQFYFTLTVVAILAVGGFIMLEIIDTMTELVFIESSSYGLVRNGEARLSAEINRSIKEIDFSTLERELEEVDSEISNL